MRAIIGHSAEVGGIPEDLPNSRTPHLVPVGDADAMAGRILDLLADDGLRREMAERAAEDAARRFGMERMVGEYCDFYRRVID